MCALLGDKVINCLIGVKSVSALGSSETVICIGYKSGPKTNNTLQTAVCTNYAYFRANICVHCKFIMEVVINCSRFFPTLLGSL